MKKILLLPAALLLLAACGGKNPKSLSDLENSSAADSMMYYLGEMQANNYLLDAESDTLLKSEEAREEFVRGFRAAMRLENENPASAYNKGLQQGLRLAIRLREFQQRYGVDFSESVLAAALENSLTGDSANVDLAEAQRGFYRIKDRFETNTAAVEVEEAKIALANLGKSRGFTMVSDTLYGKDVTPAGPGPKFKDGDRVAVEVTASTLEGQEIVTRQFPDSITIGAGRVPRVVCLGIHTMTSGQTRTFMTTPRTLFGKRYAVYRIPYDEPVVFTVKATKN